MSDDLTRCRCRPCTVQQRSIAVSGGLRKPLTDRDMLYSGCTEHACATSACPSSQLLFFSVAQTSKVLPQPLQRNIQNLHIHTVSLAHDAEAKSLAGARKRRVVVERIFKSCCYDSGMELQVYGQAQECGACAYTASIRSLHGVSRCKEKSIIGDGGGVGNVA